MFLSESVRVPDPGCNDSYFIILTYTSNVDDLIMSCVTHVSPCLSLRLSVSLSLYLCIEAPLPRSQRSLLRRRWQCGLEAQRAPGAALQAAACPSRLGAARWSRTRGGRVDGLESSWSLPTRVASESCTTTESRGREGSSGAGAGCPQPELQELRAVHPERGGERRRESRPRHPDMA